MLSVGAYIVRTVAGLSMLFLQEIAGDLRDSVKAQVISLKPVSGTPAVNQGEAVRVNLQ